MKKKTCYRFYLYEISDENELKLSLLCTELFNNSPKLKLITALEMRQLSLTENFRKFHSLSSLVDVEQKGNNDSCINHFMYSMYTIY